MPNAGISADASTRSRCVHMLHVIQTQTIKLHIVQALRFDLGGDLDLSLLAVLVGETISPANTPRVSSIAPSALDADVLEDKVPSPLRNDLLCKELGLPGLFLLLLLCCLRGKTLLGELAALIEAQPRGELTFSLDQLGVRDAFIRGKEAVVESLTGVFTGELPRLGDRYPELLTGRRVYDQVIDGFVYNGSLAPVPRV